MTYLSLLNFFTMSCLTTSLRPRILTPPRKTTSRSVVCTLRTQSSELPDDRRTANFPPTVANNDLIQSLTSNFEGEKYKNRVKELTDHTKNLLELEKDHLTLLELVDNIERLGLGYLFRGEINGVLRGILSSYSTSGGAKLPDLDLYSTALLFRLSRQNGLMVEQDVFRRFMDEKGSFRENLCGDTQGNLSLYDASFLALEGEPILDEARAFSARNLKELLKGNLEEELKNKVLHVLELPYHWRVTSLEARWSIDTYERDEKMNPKLLELAKLEYNIRQAQYQRDLKHTSSWWTNMDVSRKLSFSRDRLAESFLWGIGITYIPQHGYARYVAAQDMQLVTTIDDIYDIYGSIDELEQLTDFIDKWDINAIDKLPQYMKIPCFALFNSAHEVAYACLKEQGVNVVPCVSKLWAGLCKAYLKEAKWFHEGYKPTLNEYIDNAVITISGSVLLGNLYLSMKENVLTEEVLENLNNLPEVIKWSSMIFRLCNDFATSTDELSRGDVLKSVQCYMRDNETSEEVAREHVNNLISDAWKKINKDLVVESQFPRHFVDGALGLARMSHCYYYGGEDRFGRFQRQALDIFRKLLIDPVSMNE